MVFHRGALAGEAKDLAKLLGQHGPGEEAASNLELSLVDLDKKPDAEIVAVYEQAGKPALPCVLVRTYDLDRDRVTIWSGPLTKANVDAVIASPARREIARRILKGETAVWVLRECGDKAKDDAAAELIQKELARVQKDLKLPELTQDPDDKIAAKGPPLKVAFSLLRIRKDDAAEQLLRSIFFKTDVELKGREDEPMVFAVYGRGRSLPSLLGKGITAENIAGDCAFLVGPCSCKVKFQNPGFDLLISTDWDAALEGKLPAEVKSDPVTTPPTPKK
jgi:hypothetical protein